MEVQKVSAVMLLQPTNSVYLVYSVLFGQAMLFQWCESGYLTGLPFLVPAGTPLLHLPYTCLRHVLLTCPSPGESLAQGQ